MAKTILPDGKSIAYDSARFYDASMLQLSGLSEVWRILHDLLHRSDCCVVRGRLAQGQQAKRIRRLVYRDAETGDEPTLIDVPRRWLALDSDRLSRPTNVSAADLLACAAIVIQHLPPAFATATAIVQATAGHGLKPELRLRLWFWCDRLVTGSELGRWLRVWTDRPWSCVGKRLAVAMARWSGACWRLL